jgi:hypothetical protein
MDLDPGGPKPCGSGWFLNFLGALMIYNAKSIFIAVKGIDQREK